MFLQPGLSQDPHIIGPALLDRGSHYGVEDSLRACKELPGMAQQSSPSPAELRFEVASIKRSPPILDRSLQPFVGVPQPVIAACFSLTPQRRPKGDSNPGFAILHNDLREMGMSGRR